MKYLLTLYWPFRRKPKATPSCLRPSSTDPGKSRVTIYSQQFHGKGGGPRESLKPDPPDHRPTEVSDITRQISTIIK